MPIYEYKCEKCSKIKDLISSYEKRSEKRDCPHCDEKNALNFVDKIHNTSFSLKGKGWFDSGGY